VHNEPKYHKPEAEVIRFADRLAQAIWATGCRKPVFYNIAENPEVHEAVLNAKVDGLTFQWYPQDSVFGAFHVSYRLGLSEMNTPEEFYYTANTVTAPKQAAKLRHVAGVGSSPVVGYGGTGAYFLDRPAPGVWRLEVMPDAVPIRDPFAKTSLSQPVTQILWNEQAGQPAASGRAASLRAYFGDRLAGRSADVAAFTEVVVRARSSPPGAQVRLTLTSKDAVTYSAPLLLGAEVRDIHIALSSFRPAAGLLVPRPYPSFLPLQYQPAAPPAFKLADAEVLQVVWEVAAAAASPLSVDIESISLR